MGLSITINTPPNGGALPPGTVNFQATGNLAGLPPATLADAYPMQAWTSYNGWLSPAAMRVIPCPAGGNNWQFNNLPVPPGVGGNLFFVIVTCLPPDGSTPITHLIQVQVGAFGGPTAAPGGS